MGKNVAAVGYVMFIIALLAFVFINYARHTRIACDYYWECGKWITFMGFPLALLAVAFMTVSLGYLIMGWRHERRMWYWLGVLGIVTYVAVLATVTQVGFVSYDAFKEQTEYTGFLSFDWGPDRLFSTWSGIMGFYPTLIPLYVITAFLLLMWSIFEVMALWQAGKYFSSRTLKAAAVLKGAFLTAFFTVPILLIVLWTTKKVEGLDTIGLFALIGLVLAYLGGHATAAIGLARAKEPEKQEEKKGSEEKPRIDLPWLDFPTE